MKKNDQFVSKKIIEEGAWEEDNVVLAMKAVSLYDDAVFIGKIGNTSDKHSFKKRGIKQFIIDCLYSEEVRAARAPTNKNRNLVKAFSC